MIYYTNVETSLPHMAFIGRWTPFHKGHESIILKKLKEQPGFPILIMIRNTPKEAFKPLHRAEVIREWLVKNNLKGTIMIIPDIEGVYWGRGVGYKREYVDVDEQTQKISATAIRASLIDNGGDWRKMVALDNAPDLYLNQTARIIERGLVVWLTGYPCSGKTTISNALAEKIKKLFPYLKTQILDGDLMRANPISRGAGFTKKDRAQHIERMAHLATMFANHGVLVICAFVSPDRKIRTLAKKIVEPERFIEVYIKASKKDRLKRDVKGMYARAQKGLIKNFTGVNAPYEIPLNPQVVCNTSQESVEESVQKIFARLFLA